MRLVSSAALSHVLLSWTKSSWRTSSLGCLYVSKRKWVTLARKSHTQVHTPSLRQPRTYAHNLLSLRFAGPGSVCTTRKQTGVGYPQLSAVIETSDAAHGLRSVFCSLFFSFPYHHLTRNCDSCGSLSHIECACCVYWVQGERLRARKEMREGKEHNGGWIPCSLMLCV